MNTFFNDPPGFVQQPQRGKVGAASLVQVGGGGGDAAGLDWKYALRGCELACVRVWEGRGRDKPSRGARAPGDKGRKMRRQRLRKCRWEKIWSKRSEAGGREGGKQNKRVKDILFQVVDWR